MASNISDQWIVLELTSKADREDPAVVRRAIRQVLRDAEVYLPVIETDLKDDRVIIPLLEGYAFIRKTRPDQDYFKLEGTRYVQSILSTANSLDIRQTQCIKTKDIEKFKTQASGLAEQGIEVGDLVYILSGPYRNLTAIIHEDIPELKAVQVLIKLRSIQTIITLPRSFLRLLEKAGVSALASFEKRIRDTLSWWNLWSKVKNTKAVLPEEMLRHFNRWMHLDIYNKVKEDARNWVFCYQNMPFFEKELKQYEKVSHWVKMSRQVAVLHPSFNITTKPLNFMQKKLDQLSDFQQKYEALKPYMSNRTDVIVDGLNLAFRCMHSPGLADLKDSKGRLTGIFTGFLRSLNSYKKRWPNSAIHVCWEGSCEQRRKLFPTYKTGRGTPVFSDQLDWLYETLPVLGVNQWREPNEEADDTMASLAHQSTAENVIIVTSDKDLLQTVTDIVTVFVPAVGKNPEHLYTTEEVEKKWGVPPRLMPQLRALLGDSSDNIPGVPQFPSKILTELLNSYGSIDAIYKSPLTGLTAGQYQKIKAAEKQVKLNILLMTLKKDLTPTKVLGKLDAAIFASLLKDKDMSISQFNGFNLDAEEEEQYILLGA